MLDAYYAHRRIQNAPLGAQRHGLADDDDIKVRRAGKTQLPQLQGHLMVGAVNCQLQSVEILSARFRSLSERPALQ